MSGIRWTISVGRNESRNSYTQLTCSMRDYSVIDPEHVLERAYRRELPCRREIYIKTRCNSTKPAHVVTKI